MVKEDFSKNLRDMHGCTVRSYNGITQLTREKDGSLKMRHGFQPSNRFTNEHGAYRLNTPTMPLPGAKFVWRRLASMVAGSQKPNFFLFSFVFTFKL